MKNVKKGAREKLSRADHRLLAADATVAQQLIGRLGARASGKVPEPVSGFLCDAYRLVARFNAHVTAPARAQPAPVTPADEQGLPIALVTADGHPPHCGRRHWDKGGKLQGDPRRFLGRRVSECGACYVLVEAVPGAGLTRV